MQWDFSDSSQTPQMSCQGRFGASQNSDLSRSVRIALNTWALSDSSRTLWSWLRLHDLQSPGTIGVVTEMTVELPDDLAQRLEQRAQAQGRSLSEVIAEALGAALDENPFEFVAAFGSDEVRGASADEFLLRERFGE